jgi:hypothetical protein
MPILLSILAETTTTPRRDGCAQGSSAISKVEMAQSIDYFYRGHWASGVQARVSFGARRRMFDRWRQFAGGRVSGRLLDVGATPDTERLDSNCMIPWFHEAGLAVSVYSPEDVSELATAFPFATIVPSQGFGRPLPARAREYDWVSASAVLEHVGSAAAQIEFIRECATAGDGLFLTTPNRWHWLEFHTKVPLAHWLPRPAHRAILRGLGMPFWASDTNLRLLDQPTLAAMASKVLGRDWNWRIETVSALGMQSNLMLLGRRLR